MGSLPSMQILSCSNTQRKASVFSSLIKACAKTTFWSWWLKPTNMASGMLYRLVRYVVSNVSTSPKSATMFSMICTVCHICACCDHIFFRSRTVTSYLCSRLAGLHGSKIRYAQHYYYPLGSCSRIVGCLSCTPQRISSILVCHQSPRHAQALPSCSNS